VSFDAAESPVGPRISDCICTDALAECPTNCLIRWSRPDPHDVDTRPERNETRTRKSRISREVPQFPDDETDDR